MNLDANSPLKIKNISQVITLLQALQDEEHKNFSFYKPSPVFQKFHELTNHARIILLLAANRIGKTYSCLATVAQHATLTYAKSWNGYRYTKKNLTIWVGCITASEAEDLETKLFDGDGDDLPFIHPSLVVYRNKTKKRFKVKNSLGGVTHISIKTYNLKNKGDAVSTWKAKKVDFIMLDEQPPMEVMNECVMRIMDTGKNDRGMIVIAATCLTYTPFVLSFTEKIVPVEKINVHGVRFMDKKQVKVAPSEIINERVYLSAGWDDAPHLSEETKRMASANLSPEQLEARRTGMPSIGSGMVYPILEELITCDPFPIPEHFYRVAGIDFGWTDPTAVVFAAIDKDKNIVYLFEEYSQNEKTPQQHVYQMSQMRLARIISEIPVVYDPAGLNSSQKDGESLVKLYQKCGLKMYKANNSREAGVQTVLQRMQNGELKIFKTCHKLLSEMRTYARDENDVIKDGNDHLLDAMRYVVMSGLKIARPQTSLDEFYPYYESPPRAPGYM
jgi:hypothetical protein